MSHNKNGLTSSEVEENRKKGKNSLPEEPLKKWYAFALETVQGSDGRLNRILWGIVALLLVKCALSHWEDVVDPIALGIILTVLMLLAIKDGLKLQKAEKELRDKTSHRFVTVIRDGMPVQIDTRDMVIGDLVKLEAGQFIEADGHIVAGKIDVDNAILNGETEPAVKTPIDDFVYDYEKNVDGDSLLDQNSLFSGTSILAGEGYMIVDRVGVDTQQGKLHTAMNDVEETETAIGIAINEIVEFITRIGTYSGIAVFIILAIMQLIGVDYSSVVLNTATVIAVLSAVVNIASNAISIVVAAVPEGLPAIIRIISSRMSNRMIADNVLPRNPKRIPDAGCIDTLGTDKTKTLTIGKMVPVSLSLWGGAENDERKRAMIMTNIAFNNDAVFDPDGNIINGNPTAQALLSMMDLEQYQAIMESNTVIDSKEFNSAWKYSAVTLKDGTTYYKGAPEILSVKGKQIESDGTLKPIDADTFHLINNNFADKAMRVLAFAHSKSPIGDELPDDLVIDGLVAMRDELRKEVPAAVQACKTAGIQIIVITGDNPRTAKAIAKDAGIYVEGENIAMTAAEFDALSDDEARAIYPKLAVIGRATPQTKQRIIQIGQSLGKCVGMSGDGTNDAPALKAADVGFAMGCGTEVCKSASDIIITDNNFASIVKAVHYGRTYMKNIGKFLKFQLPINFALTILSILFPIFTAAEAFKTTMILIFNVVMDTLNAISFGGEPAKPEYMEEKPQSKTAKLLSGDVLSQVAVSTATIVILNLILSFCINPFLFQDPTSAMTARFVLTMFAAMLGSFNVRTDSINLLEHITKSKSMLKVALGVFLGAFLLVQFCGGLIGCTSMDFVQWITIIGMACVVIPVDLIRKKLKTRNIPKSR